MSESHAHPHADHDHEHAHADHDHAEQTHDDHPHDHDDHDHDHSEHDHDHDDHDHDHSEHDHDHDHAHGFWGTIIEAIPFLHGHSHGEMPVDQAMETNDTGIATLRNSLLILGATAMFQVIIAIVSHSVSLLADTIHNFSDACTAIPLWFAFALARRPPSRTYTYGYGRAEDVAGVLIVVIILASALVAAWESVQKLLHPQPLSNVGWVMVAAIVGFAGNEIVAEMRIRTGTTIGSAALVADGQHARIDGFTSLAVLIGAIGSLFGVHWLDPAVGLIITFAILGIVRDVAVTMWRRLMDAVEPAEVARIEQVAGHVPAVQAVNGVRVRWLGHKLQAELHIVVDEDLPTRDSHAIAEIVRHDLVHAQPKLASVMVHVDPCGHGGGDPHAATAHHFQPVSAG